jgi:biotin carboxylase
MPEHIMVLHRWRDRYALYEDYIDHARSQVTYITTSMGRSSVPAAAAAVAEVPATDDLAAVLAAARSLCGAFGHPARLVALNEGDLDTAALVREQLGCPGQGPADVERFRDKLAMTRLVAEAGVRTPAFADAPDARAVEAFAEREGWPMVVKPRRGTASRGVLRLDGPAGLAALDGPAPEPRLVESFCGDPIYHIDGLWTGTGLGPWRASRYVNTCVSFNNGEVLGSVEVDDPELLGPIGEFAAAVAGALSDEPWVFHLEAFVGTGPDGAVCITFLEVGYRVGGAEIPFVWREVHGVDLMSAAVAVQLGQPVHLAAAPVDPARRPVGGWLLVPTPVPAPCRVTAADLPDGDGAGPYASVVPPVGYLVPKVGGYEHVGARFRFRGASTADVESAIVKTASRFRLECVAEAGGAGPAGARQEERP